MGVLALFGACSPNRSSTNAAADTQLPADQATPTSNGETTADPANSSPGGASVQAGMSIGAATAPDLCLSVDPNNANQPLSLAVCNLAPSQRFVYVGGLLQSALGRCIEVTATSDANQVATSLQVCNPSQPGQLIERLQDTLLVSMKSGEYALGTFATPASGVPVVFVLAASSGVTYSWNLGRFTHDANGLLVSGGTSISPVDNVSQCVVGTGGVPYLAECSVSDPNQTWLFTGPGTIYNQGMCLQANGGAVATAICDVTAGATAVATYDPNQIWLIATGELSNSAQGNCLTIDANGTSMQTCSATTRSFVVGAVE